MNKALMLFVVVVFLVVGVLIMSLGSDDEAVNQPASVPGQLPPSTNSPELSNAEKDTYVNTIQTINAKYRDLEKRFHLLTEDQEEVKDAVPTGAEIQRTVNERLQDSSSKLTREFEERLNRMKARLEKQMSRSSRPAGGEAGGLPEGFGFDDLIGSSGKPKKGSTVGLSGIPMSSGWSTVMPMGTTTALEGDGSGGGILGWYATKTQEKKPASSTGASKKSNAKSRSKGKPEDDSIPVYTIPRNATLFSNVAMTALLGVIPIEGSIIDPIRFKVITGNTNLATNGLYIPGVRNIVWSGIAVGNREMSCVRGELHSVTFTFDDGTIRTVSSTKSSSNTKTKNKRILGYISDRQGSPCLKGQLITNASDYLRDRMIASSAAATASAFSSTQETTTTRSDGSLQSYFTGDTSNYIASKALSGGLTELTGYLRDRARNAVDLVYLEAGQEVVLHVEYQIDIDYDPNGRKLEYANPLSKLDNAGYYGLD